MTFAGEIILVVLSGFLIPGGVTAVFAILRMTREKKARRTDQSYHRIKRTDK
jgi:hypothetical protein